MKKWKPKHTAITIGFILTIGSAAVLNRKHGQIRRRLNRKIRKLLKHGFTNFYGKPEYLEDSPRGIRNNNPGNLIKTKTEWQGKVPDELNIDKRFVMFKSYEYGLRALILQIKGDINSRGRNTVRKIISSYAPSFENNTELYINKVASAVGKSAEAKLTADRKTLETLIIAIITMENGKQKNGARWFKTTHINRAFNIL